MLWLGVGFVALRSEERAEHLPYLRVELVAGFAGTIGCEACTSLLH